jgi:hypothetical protein
VMSLKSSFVVEESKGNLEKGNVLFFVDFHRVLYTIVHTRLYPQCHSFTVVIRRCKSPHHK